MRVGGYEIVRKIGEGAYGRVYLARKEGPGGFRAWYALKRLRPEHRDDASFRQYLHREAQLGGLVQHPALVRIHEVLHEGVEVVLVMDWVDGQSLRDVAARLRARGESVPTDVALEAGASILEALEHIHTLEDPEGGNQAFVHRDVKPGNVMLTRDGGLKLMDFGVARGDGHTSSTLQGELRGTLAYMAPEQAGGLAAGPASDQFAAGLILLELLTGGSAWGDPRAPGLLAKVVAGDVREGLDRIEAEAPYAPVLHRLLARDPVLRYESAAAAARELRAIRARSATPPALPDWARAQVREGRNQRSVDDAPSWTRGEDRSSGSGPAASPAPSSGLASSGGSGGSAGRRGGPGAPGLDGAATSGSWSGSWTMDAAPAVLRTSLDGPAAPPGPPPDGTMPFGMRGALARDTFDAPGPTPTRTPAPPEGKEPFRTPSPDDHERTMPVGSTAASFAPPPAPVPSGTPLPPVPSSVPGPLPASPTGTLTNTQAPPFPGPPTGPPTPVPAHHPPPPSQPPGPQVSEAPAAPSWAPPSAPGAPIDDGRRRRPAPGPSTAGTILGSPLLTLVAGLGTVALLALVLALLWREERPSPTIDADLDADLAERASRPRAPQPPPRSPTPAPVAPPPPPPPDLPLVVAPPPPDAAPPAALRESPPSPPLTERVAAAPHLPPVRLSTVQPIGTHQGGSAAPPEPPPRPPPKATANPRPGEVIGARTEPTPEPTPTEAAPPAPVALKLVSGREHPLGAPLSIRVRPQSFLPGQVSGWYQWRDEGTSGRRKRALMAQSDGSFLLEIPASELRADRLQIWFVADPQGVQLGSSADPLEVRVR